MSSSVDSSIGDRATFETGGLNVLLEAMRDAVVVTTVGLDEPGPVITFVNKAFEQMTGYTRREVAGQTPRMFQGSETARSELDRMRLDLEAGRTFEGQTINYRKSGAPFLLGWAVVPIFDDFGEHVAWLSLQTDHLSTAPGLEARAIEVEKRLHSDRMA